jgi:hypothetical protein
MNAKTIGCSLLMALALQPSASAENWVEATRSDQGIVMMVDLDTIAKAKPDIVFWLSTASDLKGYVFANQGRCKWRETRVIAVNDDRSRQPWVSVDEGSVMDTTLNLVCRRAMSASTKSF